MEEKLIKAIIGYVKNKKDDSAIMLNGDWGSGKTFFIKNVLSEKIKNMMYISLYDIEKIDDINERICNEIIKKKTNSTFIDKLLRLKWINTLKSCLGKITTSALKEKLGVDLSVIKKKDFVGIINQTTRLNEYVLVFDDLERSSLDIQSVLGYINNLVEHKKVKVIIVANEREINHVVEDNYELKILSCLSDEISFPSAKERKSITQNEQKDRITNKEIEDRIKYLYSNNDKYKKIKEKLVSKTYDYDPDIKKALETFLNDIDEKIAKTINHDIVIDVMNLNKCKNLRTLKVALNHYEYIIKRIDDYVSIKYKSKKETIYTKILINVLFVTIGQKKGIYIPGILKGCLCTTVTLNGELGSIKEYFEAFAFVNDYISGGYFDKVLTLKTLNYYVEKNYEPKTNVDDPFNIINTYWENESDDISRALKEINKKIKKGEYHFNLYPKILGKLSSLISIGFEESMVKEIIENMKNSLDGKSVDDMDFHTFLDDQETLDIYNGYANEFKDIIKINKSDKYKSDIELLLDKENWGEALNDYVCDSKRNNIFLNEGGFLAKFDINKVILNLKKSSNKDIFCFKYALNRVYNFSNLNDYFKADLDSLYLLIEELKKFKDCNDKMKNFALNHLHDYLIKKCEIIEG